MNFGTGRQAEASFIDQLMIDAPDELVDIEAIQKTSVFADRSFASTAA